MLDYYMLFQNRWLEYPNLISMKKSQMKPSIMWGLLLALTGLFACDGNGGDSIEEVDRKPMLNNIGPNLIVPSYQALATATASMNTAASNFAAAPSITSLNSLRAQWKSAYMAWQDCSPFGFGPADATALQNSVNVFPADVALVESNIASGSFNLDALGNVDAKGFPALDYLLYGTGTTDEAIVAYFDTGSQAANARIYLTTLTADIATKSMVVYDAWRSDSGNYLATFFSQDGADQGSSLGQLVNRMSEDYEINKNFKLGLPAGIKTVGEDLFPEKAEGYYSGISLELMRANFQASQRLFAGNSLTGNAGLGIDDLLIEYGASGLTDDINTQFITLYTALDAVPAPFTNSLESHKAEVQQAYDAAQAMVVLFKTELPSVLGVQISYQDQDND